MLEGQKAKAEVILKYSDEQRGRILYTNLYFWIFYLKQIRMNELQLLNIDLSMELIGQLKEDPQIFFNTSVFGFLPDLPL